MSDEIRHKIQIEGPPAFTGLRLSKPSQYAAGVPAVANSIQFLLRETGFRGFTAINAINKFTGFDCPGCAWPDPDDERSRLGEYCENGAKAIAEEATKKKLTSGFFARNSIAAISQLSDLEIGKLGRLAQPLFLEKGSDNYKDISWEEAFEIASGHLKDLKDPNDAVFYTSGRTSNEAAFLYQLFIRAFGTNNLPDCSNMCHESSGVALTESLGIAKGSVTLDDFEKAQVILIMGQNPGTNHPRMLTALKKAKRNGAIIITVNPLPEAGLLAFRDPQEASGWIGKPTTLSDEFLQVKINGDMPLLQWFCKRLIEEDEIHPQNRILARPFIEEHTSGFQLLKDHLKDLDPGVLLKQCGIDIETAERALRHLIVNDRIIACWAMGLTQHHNAVSTIREIVNLLLLKGSIGREGSGTCPVRGHSNVQGDRTVGIYERPSDVFLDGLKEVFGFEPPRKHGLDVVNSILAMHERKGMVFMAMGGNFLSATPDTSFTAEALRNCRITIHVSTKLNRSHLVTGQQSLILPCLARSDEDLWNGRKRFVSCENSMGVIQASAGNLKPVSSFLLSEPDIVIKLAKHTLGEKYDIPWESFHNYNNIRSAIEKVISGFENYNERVISPGGFYLPNANREGRFLTSNGKANFSVSTYKVKQRDPDELVMMTIRSHDQFNTTLYGLNDRYRGVHNERRVIFMNQEDIVTHELSKGSVVNILNNDGGKTRIAHRFIVVPYSIPKGFCATYFPEANVLVPISSVAEKSNTPVSKYIPVKLQQTGERVSV